MSIAYSENLHVVDTPLLNITFNDPRFAVPSNDSEQFIGTLVPSLFVFLTSFVLFTIFKTCQPSLYKPRVGAKYFGSWWFIEILKMPDRELETYCGHDALIYLKMYQYMFQICFWLFFPFGLSTLGMYWFYNSGTDYDFIKNISIQDLPFEGYYLWWCVIYCYIGTFIAIGLLERMYGELSAYSDEFFIGNPYSTTVMISQIPNNMRDSKSLLKYFTNIFQAKVKSVTTTENRSFLMPLQKELEEAAQLLEHYEQIFETTGERSLIRIRPFGKLVDAIEHYEKLSNALTEELTNEMNCHRELTPTAFVTFTTVSDATICATTRLTNTWDSFKVEMAPAPHDIIWENLGVDQGRKFISKFCVLLIFLLLLIFWTIPIALVQVFVNVRSLNYVTGGLSEKFFNAHPFLEATITGLLPVVATQMVVDILPFVLYQLYTFRAKLTVSEIQTQVIVRYFDCLFVMVLLASSISSVTFASLGETMTNVNSVFRVLGASIPRVSTYYLNYIVSMTCIWLMFDLLRTPFIARKLFMWLRGCGRTIRPTMVVEYSFWGWVPFHCLIFAICLAYFVVSPVLCLFGCFYFIVCYIETVYQVCVYYKKPKDTGLRQWPLIWNRCVTGLYFSHFILIGVIILKKGIIQAPCIIPLPVIVYYISQKCHWRYKIAFKTPSLKAAREWDRQSAHEMDPLISGTAGKTVMIYSPQYIPTFLEKRNHMDHPYSPI